MGIEMNATARKMVFGLLLGLSLAFSDHAAAVDSWTYTGADANGAGVSSGSSGAASLTTIGAFAANNGANGVTGNWSTNTVGAPSSALQFYAAAGLGMGSDGTAPPNASIDNNGSFTEGVLLSFSSPTTLTGIDLGAISGDADISVFRYLGSMPPTLSGTGASLSALNAAGWSLVGNYANLSADNSAPYAFDLINAAVDSDPTSGVIPTASASSVGSSYWLITAYNAAYGTGANLTQGDDYFNVLALAGSFCTGDSCGTVPSVPEPGSLAMMLAGVALCGAAYSRRKD